MKLLNTFFVALFLLSTLVYLTGCDKTNTLVYTPVTRQYPTNSFNVTSSLANGTVNIADSNLTNSFGQTIAGSTDINFLAHLPGVPASRDTILGQITFIGVKDSTFHLYSDTTKPAYSVLVIKTSDSTRGRYYSISGPDNSVTINSYGILNEWINGTFTGKFATKVAPLDTLTISNGQFSCYRRQ